MKRILHIWNDYSPVLFDQTHPICLKNNMDSYLLCGNYIKNNSKPLPNTITFRYRNPLEMSSIGVYWKLCRAVKRIFFWKRFEKFIDSEIKKIAPEILHFHFGNTAASLLGLIESIKIPVVVSYYGVDASALIYDPVWIEKYKRIFSQATIIHVLCEAVVERFVKLGCPPEKIRIWNLPPNIESYPLRKRTFDGCTRFLIAARFVEKKGHIVLLRAFRNVAEKNKKIHLTMFGYGPSEWLSEVVTELKLDKYVTLINNRQSADFADSFRKILDEHDVFLAPSTTAKDGDDEGGPALTMVCAQSAGLPVIATPFAGSEISLIDGVTGYFCKQDDVESLATAMLNICNRPDIWYELGVNGSKLVSKKFSIVNQSIKLMDIYKNI